MNKVKFNQPESNGSKPISMCQAKYDVIEILLRHTSSSRQLRLEVNRKSTQTRHAIGQVNRQNHGLHTFDGQALTYHAFGGLHQGKHGAIRFRLKKLCPGVVVRQSSHVLVNLLQVLNNPPLGN